MPELTAKQILATPALKPWTTSQRTAALGTFRYRDSAGGRIVIDPDWVKANLVRVKVPLQAREVTLHRLVAAQFQRALELIVALGLRGKLISYDGGWVARHMRWDRSAPLSSHAFAAAMDFNAAYNGQGETPQAWGQYGSLREVVPVFAACGIGWGGWWSGAAKDGMHFEARRVLAATQLPTLARTIHA